MKKTKKISAEKVESGIVNAFGFALLGIVVYAIAFIVYKLATGTAGVVSIGV